jgi:Domain of unknown function (DUF4394)/PEP-CTERM motif
LSPRIALTGVASGETVRGIDYRPSNGRVYAISSRNSSTVGTASIYTVNTSTGVLTQVGASFPFLTGLTSVSIDFNPVVDRIRVIAPVGISGANLSYVVNPDTGAVQSTGTAGTSANSFSGIAYTNNTAGATSTTLYALDFNNEEVGTINTSTGAYTRVGSFGLGTSFPNTATEGFDISGVTGVAYANLDISPSLIDNLYTVNLGTGQLTSQGSFGIQMQDITAVPEPATMAVLGLGIAAMLRRRRK